MKRLYLLRHAKSSWDDPSVADHERPLAPRGRKAVRRLERWVAEHDVRPELVICSTATRAQQTIAGLLAPLGSPPLQLDERVYHASGAALLDRIRELGDGVGDVLLVGHNPGLADLCLQLSLPGELRDRVAAKLPTGAMTTLETDVEHWSDLAPGAARLTELALPRELGVDA
jgi:phosphohistidine phosphatase